MQDALLAEEAAPMLCGGLTVFAPLVQNGCGEGKKVGIAGIGGLGHYAVQFAAALGAEVYALSHSPGKKEDCLKVSALPLPAPSKKRSCSLKKALPNGRTCLRDHRH